ncbi:MAG: acyl-homoserine-lactone acylase [Lysobacterales bacterium]|jgi:acyl-homoserine-lactone acylase
MRIIFLTLLLGGCSSIPDSLDEQTTTVHWDSWGVPHIYATNDEDFFYADGWSQMQAHANTILRLYGKSRGRAAEYWGKAHLPNDVMIHTLGHPDQAQLMGEGQNAETKSLLSAFVAGLNAYAKQHPEAIEEDNRLVLPLTVVDVNLHSLFVVNTRFVAGRELQMSQRWEETGSNALAVGPSRSESGNAMLVQNPHLPWGNEFLWFEKHVIKPGKNIYGASLVGLPGFAIAFNNHLGWTHTNNTIDNSDLYELKLEGDGYRFDGEKRPFEVRSLNLKIKHDDGFGEHKLEVRSSVHGPVVRAGKNKALALRHVGYKVNDALLQWWRMANASNFQEFESALKTAQIPFWNVIYADIEGNIFYLFNGHVPVRDNGDWAFWQGLIPGDNPAHLWTTVHPYEDLPKLMNPATGWLQNANDPPWTSTVPQILKADDYPAYMSPRVMHFRPQRAAQMMKDDDSITFEELIEYKHDTRLEMADRILDDLYAAIDEYGGDNAQAAKQVLLKWDRKADNDSQGTVLFYNWAMALNPYVSAIYETPWNEKLPLSTPDGLAKPEAAVKVLEEVAGEMMNQYGRLDIPWGEVNRIEYNGISLPANGAAGAVGVFRVAAAGVAKDGVQTVRHGDSWVGVIEFGETPHAKVLLSYGNSTQKGSPHFGDQLKLFSEKKLRDAWRTPAELEGHIEKTEQLPAR